MWSSEAIQFIDYHRDLIDSKDQIVLDSLILWLGDTGYKGPEIPPIERRRLTFSLAYLFNLPIYVREHRLEDGIAEFYISVTYQIGSQKTDFPLCRFGIEIGALEDYTFMKFFKKIKLAAKEKMENYKLSNEVITWVLQNSRYAEMK